MARLASLSVFSAATVVLLMTSGIYHLLDPGEARVLAQRLDHSAIFVMIAATFTPVHTILFRGKGRSGALLFIWTLAIVGIGLKLIYFDQISRWLGLGLYVGMGWLGLFTGVSLTRRFGFHFVQPLAWGGLAYTIGAIAEGLRWPVLIAGVIQWHELLHVAVLIGLCCHWSFIYQIANGQIANGQIADGQNLGCLNGRKTG